MKPKPLRMAIGSTFLILTIGYAGCHRRPDASPAPAAAFRPYSSEEILPTVYGVERRLGVFASYAVSQPLIEGAGVLVPDRELDDHYKMKLEEMACRVRPWDGGRGLRHYFSPNSIVVEGELTEREFEALIRDPFCPSGSGFGYGISPKLLCPLLSSVGPDGVRDVDVQFFDLEAEGYGLPSNLSDLVYDPTNGLLSGGDVFFPPRIVPNLYGGGGSPERFAEYPF